MKKIKSVEELKQLTKDGGKEFSIVLGVVRSSKYIEYNKTKNTFFVENYIDSSSDELTEEELYTISNIGDAITNGNFYFDN